MKNTDYFKGKKITVVGLARSGFACARLLARIGSRVKVTEARDNAQIRALADALRRDSVAIELGRHSEDFIRGQDLLVVSPGVDNRSQAMVMAHSLGIPVIGEIELSWQLCPATVIATTGTNGKTTVTDLLGRLIEAAGKRVHVCGNIGNPFAGEVEKMREGDYVSLEISSFQLETIATFKPHIALILNITADHFNRYRDMQEYLQVKKRLFMNQDKDDCLLLNYLDPLLRQIENEVRSKVVYFNDVKDYGLNPNQHAVLRVAQMLGISDDTAFKVFKDFKGLEHRMEYVGELRGIEFINDSKSTNAEAGTWALQNVLRPVVLIAGGSDKGLDYTGLKGLIKSKVKNVILIGQMRQKIRKAWEGAAPVEEADSLSDALQKAYRSAERGDCVLLSPMCASFDMFKDYEHRGRVFKEEVRKLIEKGAH